MTARKQTIQTAVLDAALDGIITIDARGTITEFNPAAERMFGYARAEAVGREMAELIVPPSLRAGHRAGLARYLATGEARLLGRRVELAAQRRDGTEFPVEIAILRVPGDGPASFIGFLRDQSERRLAEAALHRSEEQLRLSQKMEAVGRLAGGVAHDFNNLLTVIQGHTELLLMRVPPGDVRRGIEEIRKAGARAAGLTSQLLAFSRRQVLQPKVVDLNGIVEDMDTLLRRLIGENIELLTRLGASLRSVRADPGQIGQVIMNLAINSRDAMPRGGRLTIETSVIDLDETFCREHVPTTPGRYVMLALSDTGSGMDRKTLSHLFEPFFTTKAPGKGTGLGLATVYGIVKQSGGFIWADSEPERGTTFRIYLPPVDGPVEPVQKKPGPDASPVVGSETILVVEDEAVVRELTRRILEMQGYNVLQTGDVAEARRMCDEHQGIIHLLLADVVMPVQSGHELAGVLTARRPGLKVLYMSGYTDDDVVRHGIEQGAPFLQKPFTPRDLAAKVREVLDSPPTSASA